MHIERFLLTDDVETCLFVELLIVTELGTQFVTGEEKRNGEKEEENYS